MTTIQKIGATLLISLILTYLTIFEAIAQLQFKTTTHDFGTIPEAGGKVECSFTAVNRGKHPVVLLDVVTTCGCTVPTFSRKPIRSGEQTTIRVSFDPYGRAGLIDRKLYLYDAKRERIAILTLTGTVSPRTRTIEERYPIESADGVRFSNTLANLTYIYIGQPMRSALSLINTASEPRRIELRPTKQSGLLEVEAPKQLAAGERSAINFTYLIPTDAPRYGTIHDAMEVWIDGRKAQTVLVTHGIGIDRPTKAIKDAPPKVVFSENMLKFGAVKAASKPLNRVLTIRNEGESDLIIRKIESRVLSTSFTEQRLIKAGESATYEVILDPSKADYGFFTEQLIVVTNDPEHPVRRLRVTATIEE